MLTLRIALRYLLSKKTHNAVNVISLISVTGVAVATMAIVCVLSVFNGFTDLATAKISQLAPDLRIEASRGKVILRADSVADAARGIGGVTAATPVLEEHALAIYDGLQMPVMMKGVGNDFSSVTDIDAIVKEDGAFLLSDSLYGDFATLSVGAAIQLQAHPGFAYSFTLNVPRRVGRINPSNPAASFRNDSLLVGGVFQTEQAEFDTDLVIVPLSTARHLLEYDTEASAIELKVNDGTDIHAVADALKKALGSGYAVKDRIEQQEQSFKMISVEKWITFFLLSFILIIASFNIISTMSMLIIEKDENIHTLYALGASRKMISRIFILEGWLVSLLGGVAGIIIGIIVCLAQQWGGFIKLGGNHEAMSIDVYPVRVESADLLVVILLVAATGLFTSLLTSLIMRRRLRA